MMGMDLGPLRALVLGINQAVFGVTATITRPAPDNTPITVGADGSPLKVIWSVSPIGDPQPYGTDLRHGGPRMTLTIAKADVPTMPRGTVIVAPDVDGGSNKTWEMDGIESALADQWRIFAKLKN